MDETCPADGVAAYAVSCFRKAKEHSETTLDYSKNQLVDIWFANQIIVSNSNYHIEIRFVFEYLSICTPLVVALELGRLASAYFEVLNAHKANKIQGLLL